MFLTIVLPADMIGPGTLIVVGGAALLILGGVVMSLSVLLASVIHRRKHRPDRVEDKQTEFE